MRTVHLELCGNTCWARKNEELVCWRRVSVVSLGGVKCCFVMDDCWCVSVFCYQSGRWLACRFVVVVALCGSTVMDLSLVGLFFICVELIQSGFRCQAIFLNRHIRLYLVSYVQSWSRYFKNVTGCILATCYF